MPPHLNPFLIRRLYISEASAASQPQLKLPQRGFVPSLARGSVLPPKKTFLGKAGNSCTALGGGREGGFPENT